MRRGSTVMDLFEHLKSTGAIAGMFVRAEAGGKIGEKSRQVSKAQILGDDCMIIRIQTNKKLSHAQQKG